MSSSTHSVGTVRPTRRVLSRLLLVMGSLIVWPRPKGT